jgi:hypothetical protein
MQMGMMEQILSPGMKDGEKADFSSEMFGIGGNGAQGFRRRLEENAVDHFLVLIRDGANLFRHGEDDVEVPAVEQLGLTVLNPLCARQALALCAMPIAAAVVGIALVGAAIALFEMAAEGGGPAQLDCTHDAPLGGRQRRVMTISVGFAVTTKDIRQFNLRAIHWRVAQKYWGGAGFGSGATG